MPQENVQEHVRNDVVYLCSPVKHGKNVVGFAPRIKFLLDGNFDNALDGMLDKFGAEGIFKLADRQYNQDQKNAVRSKFLNKAVSATSLVNAINKGVVKVKEITALMAQKSLSFTDAGNALMRVGKEAEPKPEQIHWDVL